MKKLLLIVAIAIAIYVGYGKTNGFRQLTGSQAAYTSSEQASSIDVFQTAFTEQKSGIQVQGEGIVSKILADDSNGSRHQRFILTLPS
ncbi:hypothetical protein JCM14713_18460 [Desulfomicrobium salsuginis]